MLCGILFAIMQCIVKTTNPVRLTYLQSILSGADIPHTVFDAHISALEAGIGAFPRRLMVPDGYYVAAVNLLKYSSEFYDD